jgi:DNA ligase 1
MLAAKVQALETLRYPVFATPKFDGIRCITHWDIPGPHEQSVPVCRSLKPVPNNHLRRYIALWCDPGFDGEIITHTLGRQDPFNVVQSKVMSELGQFEFTYCIFDCFDIKNLQEPYCYRWRKLRDKPMPENCRVVLPVKCDSPEQLAAFNADCLAQGYEGSCFRTEDSPYKCGRSTLKEQWLVKYKEFVDEEAVCVGYEELYSNRNVAEINELGYQERSSHQENLVPMNMLGALIVERNGRQFKVGTGFTLQQRKAYWELRPSLRGTLVKYRYQAYGMKDVPRIPVFIDFRDARDTDPVQLGKPEQYTLL